MIFKMSRITRKQHKIVNRIVGFISVNMMDVFASFKRATKVFFHNNSMNQNYTFKTGGDCTFDTGCTFDIGSDCTFDTGWYCTLKTGKECVVVRRDVYEIIEIPEGKKIRLNEYGMKGYVEGISAVDLSS